MMRLIELKDLIKGIIEEKFGEEINIEIDEPSVRGIDADLSFPVFEILKRDKEKLEGIIKELKNTDLFIKVELIKGFINLKIKDEIIFDAVKVLFKSPKRYFKGNKKNERVLIEYISANPTGPLNVANARAACIGDLITKSFRISGFISHSEYYYNDAGKQVELLGISLRERVKQLKGENFQIPEEGYYGEYLKDLAKEYIRENSSLNFEDFALKRIIEMQKKSLKEFKTEFDNFVFESEIRKSSLVEETVERLKNYTYEKEGAIFFKSTEFGDEKDRVLVKSNGEYTYFLTDIVYHLYKIKRGYDYIINLWGPDHHGYIKRMEGALKALSFKNFTFLIVQQVNLKRGNELVRMSKRKGEIYSLLDLIEEVGRNAARFFLLLRASSSPLDFDLDLAKRMSIDNPLYYVQYAHARANQIIEFAKKRGFDEVFLTSKINFDEREREILKKIFLFQDIYEKIRKGFLTHLLPNKLIELSSFFHSFYQSERIVNENDKEKTLNRLFIVYSLKNLLKFTLNSMGVSAPLKM